MGATKSAEEILNNRIKVLGEEFGALYHSIYNQFHWILSKWIEYKELFATKESRIELLNNTAPSFFGMVQGILWENLLLGICKLTDPQKSAGKRNASINSLNSYVRDEIFKSSVLAKANTLREKSVFSRDWRNRYISHADFDLAVDQNAEPLSEATRDKVERFIEEFQEYINMYEKFYFNSTIAFGALSSYKSALSLLNILDEGFEAKEERMKRLRSGSIDESDLRFKNL
jgi:hypothetical protein